MVGQDREEANRLQQAKWELTSRIRDESNVPNAFHFSRRSRKRYSAETVPQPVTASQGTILCKVARNSVNRRCPMETALPGWRGRIRTQKRRRKLSLWKLAPISGNQPNSGLGDYSRVSRDIEDTQLWPVPGPQQRCFAQTLATKRWSAAAGRTAIASFPRCACRRRLTLRSTAP